MFRQFVLPGGSNCCALGKDPGGCWTPAGEHCSPSLVRENKVLGRAPNGHHQMGELLARLLAGLQWFGFGE